MFNGKHPLPWDELDSTVGTVTISVARPSHGTAPVVGIDRLRAAHPPQRCQIRRRCKGSWQGHRCRGPGRVAAGRISSI